MTKRSQTPRDPDLLARLWRDTVLSLRLMFDRRVSGSAKFIPVLAVLYILFPVDFLPEVVLGPFGIVDDVGAFLLGLQLFIRSAPREVVDEYRNGKQPPAEEPVGELHDPQSFIIEGTYEQRAAGVGADQADQIADDAAGAAYDERKYYHNKE